MGTQSMENATFFMDPEIRFVVKRFHNPGGDHQHYVCFLKPGFDSLLSSASTPIVDVDENIMFPLLPKANKPYFVTCNTCVGLLYVEGYGICNLKTQELKYISEPHRKRSPSCTVLNGSGFGYDSKFDDYKIIRFYTHYYYKKVNKSEEVSTGSEHVAEVYSLKSDKWTRIPHPEAVICFKTCAYVNTGVYYWTASDFAIGFGIVSFNFATQTFASYSFPPTEIRDCAYTLVGYNSSLVAIAYARSPCQAGRKLLPGESKKFDAWELEFSSGIGQWKRFLSVDLLGCERAVGLNYNMLFLEGMSRSDDLCELLIFDYTTKQLKGTNIFDYPGQMKIFEWKNETGASTDV